MKLNAEVGPEEMKVFVEETEELIELMDTCIIRMEKEQENSELLQDIFRAAHTIKGSSAMVGYTPMAELTHAMESLLDDVRNHRLVITADVVNALLHSLDTLKELKCRMLEDGDDCTLDIAPLVRELQSRAAKPATSVPAAVRDTPGQAAVAGTRDIGAAVRAAEIAGQNIYDVHIEVSKDSPWAGARLLQALQQMGRLGEVIQSAPTLEDIEADRSGTDLHAIFAGSVDIDMLQGDLASVAEVVQVIVTAHLEAETTLEDCGTLPTTVDNPAGELTAAAGPTRRDAIGERHEPQSFQSVRIDVQVLDKLMNIVEELVIDRSRIGRVGKLLAERYGGDDLVKDLGQTSDHVIKVINQLQDNIMKVRMMPIGNIFSRFPRLVRDLAQVQHKQVDFVVTGGETELDRSIIEQIRDPLIHLLRNCIDHGVESPDQRCLAGKPATATMRLSASQEQDHIVITLSDDGKGIDGAKARDAALSRGIITADAAAALSESQCVDLVFLAGVSTAEKVTDVSGRGVGMDIVRSNVENLGGSIRVETHAGQGTAFLIRLPLTVAIIQGLLLSSAGIVCVLPMSSVVETLRLRRSEIPTVAQREVIRLRNRIIPLLRLNRVLGSNQIEQTDEADRNLIIVVSSGKDQVGLVVDEILEPQEIVVKPLGSYLGDVDGIAGATICSNGDVALILDVSRFAERVSRFCVATADPVETATRSASGRATQIRESVGSCAAI